MNRRCGIEMMIAATFIVTALIGCEDKSPGSGRIPDHAAALALLKSVNESAATDAKSVENSSERETAANSKLSAAAQSILIELTRETPEELADDAFAAIKSGDYDSAQRLLRRAILSDRNDAGATYDPSAFWYTEHNALVRGRAQAMAMVSSRPKMGAFADEHSALVAWAANKFAQPIHVGSLTFCRVQWSPETTSDPGAPSEVVTRTDGNPEVIKVNDIGPGPEAPNADAAFEQLWKWAVFELLNADNAVDFIKVERLAIKGALTEDAYVEANFSLEWRTSQRTRRWYVEVFLPYAKQRGLRTDPRQWYCGLWGSAHSVLWRFYTDKNAYPWSYSSRGYRALRKGVASNGVPPGSH